MLSPTTRAIYQNLVEAGTDGRLDVAFIKMSALNEDHSDLATLVKRNEGRPLGLSGTFLPNGSLQLFAVADATSVVIVDFADDKNNERGANSSDPSLITPGRDYLRDHVLGRDVGLLYAFDMGPLALALWQGYDLRIKQAIDLQSAGPPANRAPRVTIKLAVGDNSHQLKESNIRRTFDNFICEKPSDAADTQVTRDLAQRAWVAHYVSQLTPMQERFAKVPPIDTTRLPDAVLRFLAKTTADLFQRDQLKPAEVSRAYSTSQDVKKNMLLVRPDRYQTRIRRGRKPSEFTRTIFQISINVSAHSGGGEYSLSARVATASGRSAQLETDGFTSGKHVGTITLMGKEDPTASEVKRAQIILLVLQGKLIAEDSNFNPWLYRMYLSPEQDFMWPADWSKKAQPPAKLDPDEIPCPLNCSQKKAIRCMLDQTDSSRVTIIQGPPGTGKTTVIASYVLTALSARRSGIWLIAQSNVAVKNIAEKLAKFSLTNWRLLVSDDFYEHWHEHLYTTIRTHTITSSEFKGRLSELSGCPVVLCTLSMLSSDVLRWGGAFRMAPLHTVVVDEASQIEIGDYIPLFSSFSTIRKAIFIGDDMQLPPHGHDDIQDLQSVFEVDHLIKQDSSSGKKPFIFLDTQYRMPPQIGDFIAQTVYPSQDPENEHSKLKSSDQHPLANEKSPLCYFVNVPGQQVSQVKSWKNLEECKAVIKLASVFQAEKRMFRIITPYDAQRSLIETELKEAELEWGDKCFNVDSFQGNEEDYIIISLVRSRDLGFLSDLRRMNVMLSRCKRGMVIFTSKAYIEKYAGSDKSLIGKLKHDWYDSEDSSWIEVGDLETTHFV
ncbi:P-loop containing nucleoside triphosphate hydrolase protein [Chiua virens]|nr:P-loop containing nucleoside triphosphate hydrolase protein [Chiua virens]